MKEACEKRTTNILDISGKKYAFDSTTIPLCLATFPWAKFRSKKGGVKAHVLYDIEAQVPAFYNVQYMHRSVLQHLPPRLCLLAFLHGQALPL
jgi:hypothetical protein